MATFKNTFIDALWRSAGMPPIALPGTSPVQYSRTPSVFIPALLAAILPTPVLTALVDAWNALNLKLTTAPPTAATIPAVTAAMTAATATVNSALLVTTPALAEFLVTADQILTSDAAQLGTQVQSLSTSLTDTSLTDFFQPASYANLNEWGNTNPLTLQLVNNRDGLQQLLGFIDASIPPSPTLTECATNQFTGTLQVNQARADILAVVAIASGGTTQPDLAGYQTALIGSALVIQQTLAWLNAQSGGPAVSIASGAPFASLQAFKTAQGF